MLDRSKIYVVVPVYNEEKNIARVVQGLREAGYTVVVVDDCSEDKTYKIVRMFPVTVLRHKINRGQGAALATGTEYALTQGADLIVHFDGDGQFLVREIEAAIEPILTEQVEMVLGSRFLEQKDNKLPWLKRKIILPLGRIVNYLFTGLKLTDAHCGFRAMKRSVAEQIKIAQDRMSHNTEIVAQIREQHWRYQEVPVTVVYHEFGQGLTGGFKIIKELFLGKLIK